MSVDEVRAQLKFDAERGRLVWADREKHGTRAVPGTDAGCISSQSGYRFIRLNGALYMAHRLVWLHQFGKWPADQIDHINGVRDDNRLHNLREATDALQRQNTVPLFRNNTSGQKGVGFHKARGKWRASIRVAGVPRHLGLFESFEAAKAAWQAAKKDLHPFNARGAA